LKDATGADISITLAAETAVPLPPELFGAALFQAVSDAMQSGADAVLTLMLKG
jgi:hypothetical protein